MYQNQTQNLITLDWSQTLIFPQETILDRVLRGNKKFRVYFMSRVNPKKIGQSDEMKPINYFFCQQLLRFKAIENSNIDREMKLKYYKFVLLYK
ncbi:unnamed protein product [Paramecium primaurelia]|uniref:Uncharacterized protein n=1 Tax=Paramecium primaurelia TaxID=5886 RepID=A0A8S1Q6R1_PARPR|nr:unnamed protein product [Paramecium primaurelia]